LRVNIDPLEGAEGRKQLAVVHTLEDWDEFVLWEDEGNRPIIHFALVLGFLPLELLDDPEAAIGLILVGDHDKLLAEGIIEILGCLVSLLVGPVQDLLVDLLAFGELVVEEFEVGIGLATCDMDRLAALELDSHGSGANRGGIEFVLLQVVVDILGDRDVSDCAST